MKRRALFAGLLAPLAKVLPGRDLTGEPIHIHGLWSSPPTGELTVEHLQEYRDHLKNQPADLTQHELDCSLPERDFKEVFGDPAPVMAKSIEKYEIDGETYIRFKV